MSGKGKGERGRARPSWCLGGTAPGAVPAAKMAAPDSEMASRREAGGKGEGRDGCGRPEGAAPHSSPGRPHGGTRAGP